MKVAVIFALVLATALAAPQGSPNDVQIVKYEAENDGVTGYKFIYETSDGTVREERGTLKNAGTDDELLVVDGSVSWIAPDGQRYSLTYTADENGFQPLGDHLPKAA